ncbi:MAG: hypothetical protein ACR2OB_00105 [Solirubrobacteraceae bacterium]
MPTDPPSARDVDFASARYETAERSYLGSLNGSAPRPEFHAAARMLAEAAGDWETAAYRHYFAFGDDPTTADAKRAAEIQAELAEMLNELWRDIADAHAGAWSSPG